MPASWEPRASCRSVSVRDIDPDIRLTGSNSRTPRLLRCGGRRRRMGRGDDEGGVTMTATNTTIGINGIAHVMLTVSQFAAARAFYGKLLPALGMTPVCDTDRLFYCVGGRTAIGIQPSQNDGDRFVQSRAGLH